MTITDKWLEDEVRGGFYVPSLMKRCWASKLVMLKDLNDLCEKLGVHWFLDGGNQLGAVRDGGFIPWDDDVDICMFREDFERFRTHFGEMPPGNIFLPSVQHNNTSLTKIFANVTSVKKAMEPDNMERYYGFPFPSSVDIIVVDPLLRDAENEQLRKDLASTVQTALNALIEREDREKKADSLDLSDALSFSGDKMLTEPESEEDYQHLMDELQSMFDERFGGAPPTKEQLFDLFEDICARGLAGFDVDNRFSEEKSACYAWYCPKKTVYPPMYNEDVSRTTLLPYEMTALPVPVGYDRYLTQSYGDYMTPHRVKSFHSYPGYRSFEAKVIAVFGEKWFYHYTFSPADLERPPREQQDPREVPVGLLSVLTRLHSLIADTLEAGNISMLLSCLEECQKAAQQLGEYLENNSADDMAETVSKLEAYCEAAYNGAAALLGMEDGEG